MPDIPGKHHEVYEYNKLFNMVINLLDYQTVCLSQHEII